MIKLIIQAPSPRYVCKIQAEFEKEFAEHTRKTDELLVNATNEYENGKSALLKSKTPGNHSAAWEILQDSQLLDIHNLSFDLDKFRSGFDNSIKSIQADTLNQAHHLTSVITAALQDFDFLNKMNRCMRDIKTKLRTQVK